MYFFIITLVPYSYDTEPRGIIYRKINPLMQNEEDMKKWLITNEQDDPR